MSKEQLKDFSIVELKLAIKKIIRCYVNDLDRKPTLKEIDSIYHSAIMEFLGEKVKWFQKERDDLESLRSTRAASQRAKREINDPQVKLTKI